MDIFSTILCTIIHSILMKNLPCKQKNAGERVQTFRLSELRYRKELSQLKNCVCVCATDCFLL